MTTTTAVTATFQQPTLEFLKVVFARATQEGLIAPDELPYAADAWVSLKRAQAVAIPEPTEDTDEHP